MNSKRWWWRINAIVSLGLLALAVWLLDWERVVSSLVKVSPLTFMAGVAIHTAIFFVLAFRWHLIARHVAPLSLKGHTAHYLYGSFLNAFTPANLGGDVYRVFALRQYAGRHGPLIACVGRERLIGLLSFLLIYLVTYVLLIGNLSVLPPEGKLIFHTAAIVTIAAWAITLALPPLISRFAATYADRRPRLARAVADARALFDFESFGSAVTLVAVSIAGLAMWVGLVALFAIGQGAHPPLAELVAITILVEVIRIVPVSVQGIGVREWLFASLFGMFGYSQETGFVVGMVSYLAASVSIIVAGAIGGVMLRGEAQMAEDSTGMKKKRL